MLEASRPFSDAAVTEPAIAVAQQTPRAASSEVGAATQPPAAPTIRRRLAALLYESVLLFGVIFLAGLAFSLVLQQRNGLAYHHLMSAWIAVVAAAYFVGFWHRGGQTLPMKTWRMRVVGPDGAPPTVARATLRYLAAWLWFLPPLALHPLFGLSIPRTLLLEIVWFALWTASARFDAQRQFLHDRIAGTRIVAVPRAPQ
ncbi:RDD family protein [Paraburkholderia sp. J12]|uniref:RDD family protein n=1 Tax=Paraburkholderia sp. J12 TaxID=2805432 RepID=UPI002ABE82A2|nr:RDD family protein [Paraburkholderia sp. J12]